MDEEVSIDPTQYSCSDISTVPVDPSGVPFEAVPLLQDHRADDSHRGFLS